MSEWGWVDEDELARVVVLSPHLDDAVLSCGQFLAAHPGATVITVFAGFPPRYPDPLDHWSVLSGFRPGDDVTAARRAEDADALALLGATPRWLDFVEAKFAPDQPPATPEEVAGVLGGELAALRPSLVLAPLGLANPEHICLHDATVLVRGRGLGTGPEPSWICYQDMGYHHIPGQMAWRVAKLFRAGVWPTPVAMPVDPSLRAKREAVGRYASQVRALEADWGLWRRLDAPTPEQYWRLAPPPPGWEALIDLV